MEMKTGTWKEDTIAAIATATSDAGIGIVRISGPDAVRIADRVYCTANGIHDLQTHKANTIRFGYLIKPDFAGQGHTQEKETDTAEDLRQLPPVLDEVLISVMRAPHSYTGEDVVEINCHGGRYVLQEALALLLKNGCRLAEPGEFTRRAFLNGRIDLTQAEAVMDVISAQNAFALENSERQLGGALREAITALRGRLLHETAYIEAALDDPENYSLEGYSTVLSAVLSEVSEEIHRLLQSYDEGILRKDGIRTAILGLPNVGKSSLLNLLAGEERSIVTAIPGTTRDVISEHIRIGDLLLQVTDTAGIRSTEDQIEQIGVERAKKAAADAELILLVLDATRTLTSEDRTLFSFLKGKRAVILLNKSDLEEQRLLSEKEVRDALRAAYDGKDGAVLSEWERIPMLRTCAKEAESRERLKQIIADVFLRGAAPRQEYYLTNLRHKEALQRAADSLAMVRESVENGMSEDFYTVDLTEACSALGELTGERTTEDLIDRIFAEFCLGK